ncbi:c-type cytochrome [Aestuariicoccus sp. MJ-SS9]|uniref:c-type cytochrome n=1 Tax=Aestuariicoccus sp. MJ-SS9 TaxID=3079855 RepID=UPI002907A7D2|nr:c-type cytochrome [Aestuariicoccus sp. MJ-SS9]MDU8913397.1 c-type cytochrome [Aestuariicoccus sp. MJ-SS9]
MAIFLTGAGAVQADESALILGKSSYGANCAICHGDDGTGSGDVVELLRVPPADLTTLSERSGGAFPFSEVYQSIANGVYKAHGQAEMPIWGSYFKADALQDRGMSAADADHIAQGRILSLVYYLQSIQK